MLGFARPPAPRCAGPRPGASEAQRRVFRPAAALDASPAEIATQRAPRMPARHIQTHCALSTGPASQLGLTPAGETRQCDSSIAAAWTELRATRTAMRATFLRGTNLTRGNFPSTLCPSTLLGTCLVLSRLWGRRTQRRLRLLRPAPTVRRGRAGPTRPLRALPPTPIILLQFSDSQLG